MSQDLFSAITPEDAHRILASQAPGQLVDVREPGEVDTVRVEGALNLPLSRLKELSVRLDPKVPVYLLCRSGARAATAAAQLKSLGHRDVFVVSGGLDAWMAAGKPVVHGERRVWSMQRQVRFTAGLLVFTGLALGLTLDRRWLFLSGFVSVGLMFSAVTDTCTMALVLARLPWNRGSCGK
jgi:rhodanese-related sulfurtransferase